MNLLRQEQIKRYIESKNVATIKELMAIFPDISLMTLHRDLNTLESMGIITKYRGGVKSVHHPEDIEFNIRLKENSTGKISMVKKALKLIKPQSSIFLDAGTSSLILARNLPDIDLNIITVSPNVALELCKLQNCTVNLCGGTMNRKNLSVSGMNTLNLLSKMNIDIAFIGVSGCSLENGFTCGTEADMQIKKLVIEKARTRIVMFGADKLKRIMPFTFASVSDVDYIISDGSLPEAFEKNAISSGVKIL